MNKSKFTEKQIAFAMERAKSGATVKPRLSSSLHRPATVLPHRGEAASVLWAWAVFAQGGEVLWAAIAFVPVEAVFWVLIMQFVHAAVAGDFGQDRCGHDRAFAGVATDDRFCVAGKSGRQRIAIHPDQIAGVLDCFNRTAHAEQGCVVDIQTIDLCDIDRHQMPGQCALDNARIQGFALHRRETFGVI